MISKRPLILEKGPEFKSFDFGKQVKRLTSFQDVRTRVCMYTVHCDPTHHPSPLSAPAPAQTNLTSFAMENCCAHAF